jgi:hypothetical protein
LSRSADIDFTFYTPIEISCTLRNLSKSGVTFLNQGKVNYVIDENGMFDWTEAAETELPRVVAAASESDPESTTFVISILFSGFATGGELLFHRGRKELSFMATVHRRHLAGPSEFCDFGWYLERMVPALEPLGLSEVTARDYK